MNSLRAMCMHLFYWNQASNERSLILLVFSFVLFFFLCHILIFRARTHNIDRPTDFIFTSLMSLECLECETKKSISSQLFFISDIFYDFSPLPLSRRRDWLSQQSATKQFTLHTYKSDSAISALSLCKRNIIIVGYPFRSLYTPECAVKNRVRDMRMRNLFFCSAVIVPKLFNRCLSIESEMEIASLRRSGWKEAAAKKKNGRESSRVNRE